MKTQGHLVIWIFNCMRTTVWLVSGGYRASCGDPPGTQRHNPAPRRNHASRPSPSSLFARMGRIARHAGRVRETTVFFTLHRPGARACNPARQYTGAGHQCPVAIGNGCARIPVIIGQRFIPSRSVLPAGIASAHRGASGPVLTAGTRGFWSLQRLQEGEKSQARPVPRLPDPCRFVPLAALRGSPRALPGFVVRML